MPLIASRTLPAVWIAALVGSLAGCGERAADPQAPPSAPSSKEQSLNARVIDFKNRLQSDPFAADARLGLGLAYIELSNPRAAEAELVRARDLGLDPNLVLPPLARTWVALGRSKELIDTHGDAKLTEAAASAEFKASLANAHARLRNPRKARELIDSALAEDPRSGGARLVEAQIALSDGRVDDALRSIELATGSKPHSAEALELKGDVLLLVKRDAAAGKVAYEMAIEANPRHVPAHARLVALAIDARDFESAQSRLARLEQVASGSPPALYLAAKLARAKGDLKTARDTIQSALAEYPKDLRSLVLGAEVEMASGSLRTAEEYLANALTVAPTVPRVRHLLAQTYLRAGTPEKAQDILEPLLRANPPDATALGLSAEAALQAGLTFQAMRLFERAAAADPDNARYRAVLAMNRISKGDIQGGFNELEGAAAADASTYSDLALLSARLRFGDLPAATKAAENVIRKRPGQAMPHWLLGRLKQRAGDAAAARAAFEKALAIDSAFVPAALTLAQLDLADGSPDKARKRFEGVLAANPTHLDALLALAEIAHQAGEPESKVRSAYDSAVRQHPNQAKAWLGLINHQLRVEDPSGAMVSAQTATAALPDDLSIADALGRAQTAAGESAQALTTFRKIVSARPRSPEPLLRMADVYVARGEVDSAIEYYRQATVLGKGLLGAQVKLVGLLTVKKSWNEALAESRAVQRKWPQAAEGYHLEGLVLAAQRKWDPAVSAFRAGMQRRESSELAIQLHGALMGGGKVEEAGRMAADWIRRYPADNEFLRYQGDLALVSRDYASAEGHYRAMLKNNPQEVNAMNNLAWLLVQQSKPGALDLARKAVELRPKRADILDTLSLALAANNQMAAAIENQKKVVEIAPKVPQLRLNLAKLAVQAKDYPLARTHLDQLSALGKEFPAQNEVWELRKQLP